MNFMSNFAVDQTVLTALMFREYRVKEFKIQETIILAVTHKLQYYVKLLLQCKLLHRRDAEWFVFNL